MKRKRYVDGMVDSGIVKIASEESPLDTRSLDGVGIQATRSPIYGIQSDLKTFTNLETSRIAYIKVHGEVYRI